MSLQRVFESARKLGVPVIITDPAGREPLVVMSLEQFEMLRDGMSAQPSRVVEQRAIEQKEPKTPPEENKQESVENALEERFYFEPVEDQ